MTSPVQCVGLDIRLQSQVVTPLVSVIIVNWNGERFLDRCLTALLAQRVAPHEIILVDNASTDASRNIAHHFPSVRLLAQNENLGLRAAITWRSRRFQLNLSGLLY